MHRSLLLAMLLGGAALATAAPAGAATFNVVTTADAADSNTADGSCSAANAGGQCTLRAAIGQANFTPGIDRIVVPAGTYQLLDGLGELVVGTSVSIEGAGARTTTIKAPTATRVMTAAANLSLRDVGLTGGAPTSSGAIRGGGLNVTAGDVSLERVWVYGNTISSATNANGGGVAATGGSLSIFDSVISGNTAVGQTPGSGGGSAGGGGVSIAAPTIIRRSTITANITRGFGAGQFSVGGGVSATDETTLEHVTIAGNTSSSVADSSGFRQGGNLYIQGSGLRSIASSILSGGAAASGPNCYIASGSITEPARNISNTAECLGAASIKNASLQLGALANNGGPTDTMLPAIASPAVGAAVGCGVRAADQRGGALPAGAACDLGAVEVGADRRLTLQASKTAPAAGEDVTLIATITNDGPDDTVGETVTIPLPAGATATTATSTLGTCTGGTAVTCTVGTLADGAAATVIATVRASGAAATITATRAGALPDPAAGNDQASVSFAAGPVAPPASTGGEAPGSAGAAGSGQSAAAGSGAIPAPAVTGLKLAGKPTLRRGAKVTFTLSQ
ncbi:MAG: DUF11 domain-containing protein, partial [Solirubrobacteraceae bacterium]|nr:DUF11 domain-containing protein [Solirubrobacteraceae bacterium]